MSLEELKTAAMAALYGPLAKGAEKERWRRVEVTPTDADAKSEDSWASEKEEKEDTPMDATPVVEYVGVADIKLERARPEHDPLVPASGAPREEVNDAAAWAAVAAASPEPCEVARRETLRALARRAGLWCSSGGEPEGEDGGDEARARVMTKADVEAAAHGLWEMATDARARGADDFHDAPEAFDAVVGLMEADESIVTPAARRYALAAAWSLAVSARGRAGLLAAEGFKGADDGDSGSGAVVASVAALLDAASAALERLEAEEAKKATAAPAARAPAEEEDKRRGESVGGDAPEEAPVARAEPPTAEAASSASVGETSAGGDASSAEPASAEPVSSASSDAVALFEHAVGAVGVLAVDKAFRAAYARRDPSFAALVKACGASSATAGGTALAETCAGLRATAARALASTLIRDGDCRKRAIKSGGFGALVALAADAGNDDVRRAASETVASFAREPRVLSKVKTLDADVRTCARAMGRCLAAADPGSADPARKSSRVAKDTARAVCASMAGMLRALVRRAASARKRAAADGDPAAFAAATKPVSDGVLSQVVTHAHAVSTTSSNRAMFGEMHAAASFGALAALAEDRASCARVVRLGDRPRTPPPFTEAELEAFQLEAFKARKEGREYAPPVRVKAAWDPALSVVETCKKTLARGGKRGGSPDEGCARVAAAAVLARVLEHEREDGDDVPEDARDVERALEGEHRAFLAAEGVTAALLASAERGASAAWRAPLAETTAAALMYLATPLEETCPRAPEELRRLAALAVRPVRSDVADGDVRTSADADADADAAQTGVSAQFLAAAVWSIARSPLGRASLLRASPELIASLVAAGSALVPMAREAAEAGTGAGGEEARPDANADADADDADPRVVALEFLVAAVWLLTYGDADPALEHGEVYDAADDGACYWTVARKRAPTLAEAATDAAWASAASGRRGAPSPEDLRAAEARARAEEARERVGRMRAIERKGDSPPMTSKEAESAAVLAENAVLDAEAAARDAAATHAATARGKRLAILTFLRDVAALPASRRVARARIAAVGAGWNACARSPEARREAMELGFFDALEACALQGGAAATTACVLAAYDAMEAMVGSYDDVCAFAGGPKRLARVAALFAKSPVPLERERGARALAFITSSRFADRADAAATKAALLAGGAVASLLAMLCPEEEPEPEPMDEDDDTEDDDADDSGPEEAGDGDGSVSSSSKRSDASGDGARSRNEIARSTETFAAAALLNVSSLPAAQIALAKRGLYTLLKTNASAMTSRTSRAVGGGAVNGGDLVAGCIHNVAGHPANRTRVYRLELRAKAMERVLHNRRSAKHVGHEARRAARLVGDAHERAAETKTTFEKVTRRRRRVARASGAPEEGTARPARDDAPAANAAANAEDPGGRLTLPAAAPAAPADAPGLPSEDPEDAAAAAGPAAPARDSGSESDWSSSDAEDDARATASAASVDRGAIRAGDFPRAQADDDWLEGMMTRYAASEAGESARRGQRSEDAVFADGLALLAHSMRAPLRRVWATPARAPDARVTGDPGWTANRGATRVVMADPPRGAPRGGARWRPPVREYRERGATRVEEEEALFVGVKTPEASHGGLVEPAVSRLLTATIPADATARLEGKAAEVAVDLAFGAPVAFGGLGSDAAGSGLAGSLRAPDPSLPVARASFATRRASRSSQSAAGASSGGADAANAPAENRAAAADADAADAPPALSDDEAAAKPPTGTSEPPNATGASNATNDDGTTGASNGDAMTPAPETHDVSLEVVLEPCDRRRVVSFGAHARNDGASARDARVARLSVFEHTPGARAHLDAGIPAYRLPNGKRAFYYHAGGDVVGECAVAPPAPPARPTTLRLARRGSTGMPASSGALRVAEARLFPEAFRPAPALCAPPRAHTLAVADARDVSRLSAFGDVRPRAPVFFATEVLTRRAEEEHLARAALLKKASTFDGSKKGNAKPRRGVSFAAEPEPGGDEASSDAENAADAREAFDPRRHSVFATRVDTADARDVFDRDAAYDAAFDADWRAWTEPSARGGKFLDVRLRRVEAAGRAAGEIREPGRDPAAELRAVARAYYDEFARAHRYFAASYGEPSFPSSADAAASAPVAMPRAAFDAFATKCGLARTRTACTAAHVAAFYEAVAGSASAPLARAQFLELLVRVADAKYAKSGAHHSLARALETLAETDVLPRAGAEALADPDAFREQRLYVEATDDVFRGDVLKDDAENEEARLEAKFDADTGARLDVAAPASARWRALVSLFGALAGPAGRVAFGAFAASLAMAGVVSETETVSETTVTETKQKRLSLCDARRIFVASQMRVSRAEPPRDATLAFEDWLEALARVADAAPPPFSDEDARDTGDAARGAAEAAEAAGMVSAAETVNETAEKEAFKTRAIDGEGEGSDLEAHDAPEEAFAARALASKLDGFLEHVLRRAWRAAGEDADAYDAERAVEALKGLTM